jgi:hypothetical protein
MIFGLTLGCSTPRSLPEPSPRPNAKLEVRLVSSGYDCGRKLTLASAPLAVESRAIAATLAAQGVSVKSRLTDPAAADLIAAFAAEAHHQVLWMYSGHGDLVHPGTLTPLSDAEKQSPTRMGDSVLCLKDGPLPIERLVRALPRSAPFVVMIVNACFSADVDVRGAPTDMALVSLSTQMAKTDVGRTPLGEAMRLVSLAALDRDCDGALSDLELFAYLQDETTRRGYGAPILKLRRQTHLLPTLAATTGCRRDLPVERHTVDLQVTPYEHYGLLRACVTGYVPADASIVLRGQTIASSQLHATGCRSEIGQCFQLLPSSDEKN